MLVTGFTKVTTFAKTLFHKYSPTNNKTKRETTVVSKAPKSSAVGRFPKSKAAASFLIIYIIT